MGLWEFLRQWPRGRMVAGVLVSLLVHVLVTWGVLWGLKGGTRRMTVDEHRKNIESLPPGAYQSMSYYERWVWSLAQCLIQRGIITTHELGKKLGDALSERSHHDMGGRPAGKIERTEHDYEEWERRVDAFMVLLAGITGGGKLMTIDERRKNIEALTPEAYDNLRYYERMLGSMTLGMIQRGRITTEELARKMAEVEKRGRS